MAAEGASSSSSGKQKYDVFLSFRGEDTRTSFTDHLFNALVREGILTFRDNEELNKGEDISSGLEAAIQDSRVAIIVFSQNYASSTWCLGELQKILDCKRDGQIEKVLPVFYKIDPSDVRKQSNIYAQAFLTHEERFQNEKERVNKWRSALKEAANLSGWDQQKVADGHEAELIKRIVTEVLAITNPEWLHVAKYPTGLHSHVDAICGLVNEDTSDAVCGPHKKRRKSEGGLDVVRTIGIYGQGGIGKTTIAKAVFNKMSRKFDGGCFLADVREVSSQQQGSVRLQKQLLSKILKGESIEIHNEHSGINMINNRLCCKKVLIVFDDVEKMTQLNQLVGDVDWFCPGSRIILTTRDEHLLTELDMDEKCKYKVEIMDVNESLRLFSRHAFRQEHPVESYEQLSKRVVHYAGGLPLALVILGSLLYERSPIEWECKLKKLKEITIDEVSEKLKISYDALDKFDQSAFLDISCFFIGWEKDQLSMILDACYPSGEVAIKNLKERSLVTIDEHNRIGMHDLIRDMGREIVCNESPKNPRERSRVWKNTDAIDILKDLTGTVAVEGLRVVHKHYKDDEFPKKFAKEFGPNITLDFSKMPNLRFLQIDFYNGRPPTNWEPFLPEGDILFKNLVWLYWYEFPFKCIPDNFHLGNLVILEMLGSNLELIWEGTKNLPMLKFLDLVYLTCLTQTPDFSGVHNLVRLRVERCISLVEIHESIHCLKKLVELKLGGCPKLKNLPRGINKLESLEVLDVSYCYQLENLPEGFGELKRLKTLDLSYCYRLENLPEGFRELKRLKTLDLSYCYQLENLPEGFGELKRLKTLDLSHCNWTDDGIAVGLGELSSLESLDLSSTKLKCLPMLPSSLRHLKVECQLLERLPNLSNLKQIRELKLLRCGNVTEIEGLECFKSATLIDLSGCVKSETSVKKRIFQDICKEFGDDKICDILLPGIEVPDWFAIQNDDCRVVIAQPHNIEMQPQQGLIICSTFEQVPKFDCRLHVEVVNNSKNSTWKHAREITQFGNGITWMMKIPNSVWKSIAAQCQYEFGDTLTVSAYSTGFEGGFEGGRYRADQIGFHFF